MSKLNPSTVSDTSASKLAIAACVIYCIHAIFATATHRGLYGDAAFFLTWMVTEGHFTYLFDDFAKGFSSSRITYCFITQLPTLTALWAGIKDASILSWIFGATLFSQKIISIWLCHYLLPDGKKLFILFPVLGIYAGTINSDVFILSEAHMAVSIFWPFLIALTFVRLDTTRFLLASCMTAVLLTFIYETVAFFAPIALLVLAIRTQSQSTTGRRNIFILSVFLTLATISNWLAILFPRDAGNKVGFVRGLLQIVDDTLKGVSYLHIGPVVSLIALIFVTYILLKAPSTKKRKSTKVFVTFAAFLFAVVPPLHFLISTETTILWNSSNDRGFSGLVTQFVLIILFLYAAWMRPTLSILDARSIASLILGLALGQAAWQMLATISWHNALSVLQNAVAVEKGVIKCSAETISGSNWYQIPPDKVLCEWWITPLSMVQSEDWKINSLVFSNRVFSPYHPFNTKSLPSSEFVPFDFSEYKAAVAHPEKIDIEEPILFTTFGNGFLLLRDGFATAEDWGTWTINSLSTLQLCGLDANANRSFDFIFTVSPFVPKQRPTLSVETTVNGHFSGTWRLSAGEKTVNKSVTVYKDMLDEHGCAEIILKTDHPISPKELGISEDSRKLGIALERLEIREVR